MKNLPSTCKSHTFVRQEADYEAAGLSAEREILLPFDLSCVNEEVLTERGLQPAGVVRQLNQVTVENIGNALGSKIRAAVAKKEALPTQADVDKLVASYDFSGLRTTGEAGMPESERMVRAELRSLLRSVARDGAFDPEGKSLSIQTEKEAKAETLPAGKISIENFNNLVEAAAEGVEFEFNTITFDFGAEVKYIEAEDGTKAFGSYSAILDFARSLAQEKYEIKQRSQGIKLSQ